jgi:TonB family protein
MIWNSVEVFAGPFLARMADASLRAIALAVLVGLFILFLRRRSTAQHALWALVMCAMLALVLLRPVIPAAHLHLSRPAVLDAITIDSIREIVADPSSANVTAAGIREKPPTLSAPLAVTSTPRFGWQAYAATILLAGMIVFAGRLTLGIYLGSRLFRHAPGVAAEVKRRFGAAVEVANLEMRESNRARVPVTVGLVRARIILPTDWREWPAEKMAAVLAHESAHVRRRDPLVAFLSAANKCVFWFHPLAWWLERRLAVLAEHAADDAGLEASPDAQSYARVVVEVAASIQGNGGRLIWHAAAMNGPLVAQRIRRVMDPRARSRRKLGVFVRTSLALGVGFVLWIGIAADFQSLAHAQDKQSAADSRTHFGFMDEPSNAPEPTTVEEASALERRLATDPEDEHTRAQLIRYYWNHEMEEQRIPLVLWLIEHHPESPLHGDGTASIFPSNRGRHPGDPDAYADASRLWREQVNEHPQDPRVLGNAAYALGAGSMWDEVELMKRAQALAPEKWTKPLAELYSYILVYSTQIPNPARVSVNPLRNPELASQIRTDLQTSNDVELVGTAALEVVQLAVRMTTGHEGGSWEFAVLRTTAQELVSRAETLDPQNQHVVDVLGGSDGRWSDLMEGVKGLPETSAPSPSTQSSRALSSSAVREPNTPRTPNVVLISQGVATSLLQEAPKLVYPDAAKTAGVQGTVRLQVQIGIDGHVTEIKVLSGHPLLVPAAIDAVRDYIYKPYLLNGNPVAVKTTVDAGFGDK